MANSTKVGALVIDIDGDISKLRTEMAAGVGVVKNTSGEMQEAARAMKAGLDSVLNPTTLLTSATNALHNTLAGLGVGIGLASVIKLSDEYTKFTAQLKLATQTTQEYAQAYGDVKRIANSAQADLAATGVLYARIANGTRELGLSQQKVADITETVNLALKVSGATTEESASAMLQLSQSFASGTLRGEEFNAVNEAAPRLMKALADGIGVPIGALKQMASDGKITSQVMAQVLPKALADLRAEAESVRTIGGAWTVLTNNMLEYVGTEAKASSGAEVLTSSIGLLANNLHLVAAAAGGLGAAKLAEIIAGVGVKTTAGTLKALEYAQAQSVQRAATIATSQAEASAAIATSERLAITQGAIVASREGAIAQLANANASIIAAEAQINASRSAGALSFAVASLATGEVALTAAMQGRSVAMAELAVLGQQQARVSAEITLANVAQAASQSALTVATGAGGAVAGVASRALGLLGGPIGLITTLLGVGVTAWLAWGSSSSSQEKIASENVEKSTADIVGDLDKQIAKLKERNALASSGLGNIAKQDSEPAKKMVSLKSQMDAAQAGTGEFAGLDLNARNDILQKLGVQYGTLYQKINAATAEQKKFDATGKVASDLIEVRERLLGVNRQYLDDLTKLEAAREKGAISEQEYIDLTSKLATETYNKTKAGKEATKAAREENTEYDRLIKSIAEKTAIERLDIETQGNLTAGQKLAAKAMQDLRDGVLDLTTSEKQRLAASFESYLGAEKANIALKTQEAFAKTAADENLKYADSVLTGADALRNQVRDQEAYNERIGLTQKQIAELDAAELEKQATSKDSIAVTMDLIDWSGKLGDAYRDQANSLRALAELKRTGAAKSNDTDLTKATDLLAVMSELDNVAKAAAQGMTASFGTVGTAIGGMTTALTGFSRAQAAIAAQLAASTKDAGGDQSKIYKANATAAEQTARAQISSYANMASAAKGFFKENTTGYKIMEAAEKGYRAIEMAMAIESMLTKSGLMTSFTGLFVASKATETGVILATESTMTAATLTGEAARNAAKVPGVFMSFMSMLGPWGAAAAAIAIGAVLGGAFSGGSAPSVDMSAAAVQKRQGTGTVFGDSDAKSESIAKSLELLEKNSDLMTPATMQMASSLRNIESSMAGLTNIVFRTPGITSGSNFDIKTGTFNSQGATLANKGLSILPQDSFTQKLNNATSAFLFGSSKSTITDGGLQLGGSIGSLQQGQGISQYANVNTVKKGALGGLFGGSSNTNTLQTQAVSNEIAQQFGLIFTNLQMTLSSAATALGGSGQAVGEAVNNYVIDTTKISLTGLKGADLQNAINGVISGAMDNVAQSVFPELDKFRQVGEGYTQTVVRIAVDYSNVDAILNSLGMTFGAVGISSVEAREHLIGLTGGIDKLASGSQYFAQNFLSDAERMKPVADNVSKVMDSLGLSGVTTIDQFKNIVLGLDLSTEAGASLYATLIGLAPQFKEVADYNSNASGTAKQRADLEIQIMELTGNAAGALAARRDIELAGMDASLRPLQQRINLLNDEADAAAKAAALGQQRTGLEIRIMELSGDKLGALNLRRQQELDGLDASLRPYQLQIYALEDKAEADKEAAAAAEASARAATQAGEQAAAAAKQLTAAWQSVTDAILGEVSCLRGAAQGTDQDSFAATQARFVVTTAQARAGDQDAAKLLAPLSVTLAKFAENSFSTLKELNQFRALTAASLAETANGFTKYGVKIPGFASGGDFGGGLRLVGEHGPEIEATGASRIFNASQTRTMLGGSNDALVNSLIAEVRELKSVIALLVTPTLETEKNTRKIKDNIQHVTLDGEGMRLEKVTA